MGCGVGFLFALVALCVSVVSFPLMLDRHASATDAMLTSVRAVVQNPVPMAAWGLIVAILLIAGTVPFFLGLTVAIPVLGHATWHLYRKVIEPVAMPYDPRSKPKCSATRRTSLSTCSHGAARIADRPSQRAIVLLPAALRFGMDACFQVRIRRF
jgi:hypothetical protein